MFDDCVILAGGSGTRLWPASNSRLPKQFLPGPGGKSFFTAALERAFAAAGGEGRVIVIAGAAHVPQVIAAVSAFEGLAKRLILLPEPEAKNTAAAVACASVYAGPGRTMLVLTSDHIIEPLETFAADASAAAAYARRDNLAVFGIPPRAPETGYGYIEAAEKLEASPVIYRAASFREKPRRAEAERFLAAGNFFWNSGMFAFSTTFIIEEFKRLAPEVLAPFAELAAPDENAYNPEGDLRVLSAWKGLEKAYSAVRSISFDYAVAEKCRQTVMVSANFDWYDVGSWDEYARLGGPAGAEIYAAGAADCFVDAGIPVALCGVEDLIVVIRSGVALIARRGETQRVRDIVEQIKAAGRTELL